MKLKTNAAIDDGIFLSPTCKVNHVYLQFLKQTCNLFKSACNTIMLTCNII